MLIIMISLVDLPNAFFSEKNPRFCVASTHTEDKDPSCSSSHSKKGPVLVIGALQFIGARLVSHLVSTGRDVRALASYESVLLHDEDLVWYRDQQLRTHHGITVEIANLSSSTQVASILKGHAPSEIVFVPPGLDRELVLGKGDSLELDTTMSQSVEELVLVLESMRRISICTRVLLVSHSKSIPDSITPLTGIRHRWLNYLLWVETFELVMSTFHNLYRIPMGIFRLGGVHGPWGHEALRNHLRHTENRVTLLEIAVDYCWFVDDVVSSFVHFMERPEKDCLTFDLRHCATKHSAGNVNSGPLFNKAVVKLKTSLEWAESFINRKIPSQKNIVFTSYFVNATNQHFEFMADFYLSLRRFGMNAVVFHNGLDDGFTQRMTQRYPNLIFNEVDVVDDGGSALRNIIFHTYYEHLRMHPEIDKVLLSEMTDVTFQDNPFELMSVLGDLLYVGTDVDFYRNMKTTPGMVETLEECFGNNSMRVGKLSEMLEMDTVYNAGIIGGSREVVLDLLAVMVAYLDTTPASLNCNMPTLNYAVHRHFFGKVFTGFPLTSRFLRYQTSPKGVYVVHK